MDQMSLMMGNPVAVPFRPPLLSSRSVSGIEFITVSLSVNILILLWFITWCKDRLVLWRKMKLPAGEASADQDVDVGQHGGTGRKAVGKAV